MKKIKLDYDALFMVFCFSTLIMAIVAIINNIVVESILIILLFGVVTIYSYIKSQ